MPGFAPVGSTPVASIGTAGYVGVAYTATAANFTFTGIAAPSYVGAGNLDQAKMEVGAWYHPPADLSSSKQEVGAWLIAPDEIDASKMEVGAWIIAPSRRPKLLMSAW